ncbi:UNVERIFIED_ORG: Trk-type K+ transport system membrane component [Arthrobacter sp. UYCu721]
MTGYRRTPLPQPGHYAGISGLLLEETVSTEEKPPMTQRQSRPRNPASWHPAAPEREGLWIFTCVRDFIDDIANTSPARLALSAFGAVCLVFTFLLSLPVSSATGTATPIHQALFTAVSAVCVTGLTVVSTAVHWSFFGQLVILIGIFGGGLGTLTPASLLALMVSKKLGVRGKLIAQEAMNNTGRLGEVGTVLRIVGLSTNLSAELPPSGIYVLTALMSGRVGTVTLAAGPALRQHSQLYHYPEERPIIG